MGVAIFTLIAGLIAVIYAVFLVRRIYSFDPGNEKMQSLSSAIQEGAMAFLKREYSFLAIFIIGMFILLTLTLGVTVAICYVCGAICSVGAGFVGMRVATRSNCRTTQAATKSISDALTVAFSSGAVMGMCVVGFGLVGLSLLYLFVENLILSTVLL